MEPIPQKKTVVFKNLENKGPAVMAAVTTVLILNIAAYFIPMNLLDYFGTGTQQNRFNLINYAPEVWLSLLALVFGTLIIVVSIASESTPKLIDLFVGDYKSRLFIWLITLSSLENIFLQLIHTQEIEFYDNLIFLNNYFLLPSFVLLSIPYIFYILKYTKNSNVIEKIYQENRSRIKAAGRIGDSTAAINQNQYELFETINQLHDLLQHVRFKEPKADIIHKFGKSLRYYLNRKKQFSDAYFILGHETKRDISFRTLTEKFRQLEEQRTFYEQKVLRIFGTSYLLLLRHGDYDLASLCGNEICETGKTATDVGDVHAVSVVLLHFNTLLRHGINHGLRTKEIKNVYNTIFHYSQLLEYFVRKGEMGRIVECCNYFAFYGSEVTRLSDSEASFVFLVDAFATELKKILVMLYDNNFSRDLQIGITKTFNELNINKERSLIDRRIANNGFRLIQISLCLFYIKHDELQFSEMTTEYIIRSLGTDNKEEAKRIITLDCDRLGEAPEEFWEDTDQGNRNIFYSPHKDQIPKFHSYFLFKLASAFG